MKKKEKQRLEKEKKELKEKQGRERKEQKEREKREHEMKKKFNVSPVIPTENREEEVWKVTGGGWGKYLGAQTCQDSFLNVEKLKSE